MDFLRRNINKTQRNGNIYITSNITSYSSYGGNGGSSSGGNYLPAIPNGDGTYTVNLSQVIFNGDVIAQGEVAAYQSGTSEASSGTAITVYDGLDSDSALIALSANQGRILKELIDSIGGSGVTSGNTNINIIIDADSLSDNQILVYDSTVNGWVNKPNEGISEISKLKDVQLTTLSDNQILQYDATSSKWVNKNFNTEVSALTEHINDTVKHITEEERTKWNNKLDKSVWDSAFYFDANGNIRVKLNLIGEGEISAYGSGSSTSNGAITIVDNLTSTLSDAALSANQGRILKGLIDNVDVDLSDYYNKDEVDELIANADVDIDLSDYSKTSHTHSNYSLTSHTHPISAITSLQSTLDGKSETGHSHSNYVTITNFNTHSANTTAHVTTEEKNKWNDVYTDWNDVFEINSDGSLKVKVNLYSDGEISAYGSGSSESIDGALENYYTKSEVDDLIENIDVSGVDIDLSEYSKTSHTHSNYAALNHAHNYASSLKLGSTSYNVSANTISLPSYPTLTSLSGVSTSTFNSHSANTTAHITEEERTKWNNAVTSSHTHSNKTVLDGITSSKVANWDAAYTNNHIHSNKSVLDGITSTKVANWDKVYEDWNDVFEINSDGDLQVKVNVIGEGEISAYGSDSSTSNGAITIVDNLTSTATTAALSANQGRELKNLIDNIDVDVDLSDYSKTGHTHNEYASSSHTHPISAITSLQTTLDGKSGTGHSHSNYSLTSHTHSLSALTSTAHTHSIYYDSTMSRTANTVLAAPNGKAGGATFRSLVAADIPTLAISKITNLQSTLDAKSGTGHSHSNYSLTSHTHNYAGSSSAGGAATSANKVNSTLTFSGGTFAAKTFNGSAAVTVNVPTHTSHITNNSGYITTAATVTNADKLDGYHGSSSNSGNTYVLRNSDGSINVGAINASGNTNIVGNLCVTGEITAYADGGNATPFIYNATSYSSINSTATNQVPTVNVVTLIKNELEATKTRLDTAEGKLNKIKTYLNSLTSSSTLANVLTALINIKNNI